SIEDVINRAQVEDEQEQRMIAQQEAPGAPLDAAPNAGGLAPTQPANFNSQQRPSVSQPANYNGQQLPGAGLQPTIQPASNSNIQGPNGPGAVGAPPAIPERRQSEGPFAPNDGNDGTPLSLSRPGNPDTVVASLRPENVDRAVSRMLAEEKTGKAAVVAGNANSPVSFNLSPKPIKERVGKTFKVTVEVSGDKQMSGADI